MSDLYSVKLLGKSKQDVTFDVTVVHPDALQLPENKGFALMLLWDSARDDDPIRSEIGLDDILGNAWLKQYTSGFIASVKVSDVKNRPPKGFTGNDDHPYWHARPWMSATYKIAVTDPAWISHLKPTQTWESTAFAAIREFDKHAPIAPDASSAESAADEHAGLMPVPGNLWAFDDRLKPSPAVVWIPKFGSGAYRVKDELAGPFDAKRLAALENKAVRLSAGGSTYDGILALRKEGFWVASLTSGSFGLMGNGYANLEKIGLLEQKPKARTGEPIAYSRVLDSATTSITGFTVKGATITFDLALPHGGKPPEIKSAADVLRILAKPIVDYSDRPVGNSALAKALRKQTTEDEDLDTLATRVGNGFVTSYKLALPRKKKIAIDDANALDVFSAPNPTGTLSVAVTAPAFLAHWKKVAPFAIDSYALAKAKKCAPIKA